MEGRGVTGGKVGVEKIREFCFRNSYSFFEPKQRVGVGSPSCPPPPLVVENYLTTPLEGAAREPRIPEFKVTGHTF